ncbi:MAG: hypothetical protein H0T75_12025 [Rhizobiales bacterium]|nr:hypothetical protein [Hyphomicrobiales bacterium]MDQ3559014.1 hypothetical protein [Pseudomonadota bacterium]
MRVFFDENIPRQLRHVLPGHEISSVEVEGWKGKDNGELLALIVGRFDVLITSDDNLSSQQNLIGRNLSIVVVPTNKLTLLRANAAALRITLEEMASYDHQVIVTINWKGKRVMRRLDHATSETSELTPVSPFRT